MNKIKNFIRDKPVSLLQTISTDKDAWIFKSEFLKFNRTAAETFFMPTNLLAASHDISKINKEENFERLLIKHPELCDKLIKEYDKEKAKSRRFKSKKLRSLSPDKMGQLPKRMSMGGVRDAEKIKKEREN